MENKQFVTEDKIKAVRAKIEYIKQIHAFEQKAKLDKYKNAISHKSVTLVNVK